MSLELTLLNNYGLLGVFLSTLIAYSILPFPSEAAIIAATFFANPFYVLVVALIGGTLGSLTNYYIGKKGVREIIKNKKIISRKSKWNQKAHKLMEKYGGISIFLFGNFPLIGDPIMILAGSLNMKLPKFLFYSTLGKTIYFIIVIFIGKSLESTILGIH